MRYAIAAALAGAALFLPACGTLPALGAEEIPVVKPAVKQAVCDDIELGIALAALFMDVDAVNLSAIQRKSIAACTLAGAV